MKIGMHLEITDPCTMQTIVDGYELACFQVMLSTPRSGEVALPKDFLRQFGVPVYAHAPFYINPAQADPTKRRQMFGMWKSWMKYVVECGATGAVVHAGSGPDWTLFAEAVTYMTKQNYPVRILMENDSGCKTGQKIGSVKNLLLARNQLGKVDDVWVMGLVLDTAHAFANAELAALELAGKLQPELVHLNEPDLKVKMGKHLDRHNTPAGEGSMGLLRLASVLAQVGETPCIIEASTEVAIKSLKRYRSYAANSNNGAGLEAAASPKE